MSAPRPIPPAAILPAAAVPMVGFASVLRDNGFAVAPQQTQSFIAAVGLLGPRTMEDIRRAASACFAPPPDRIAEFDALFRLVFLGQSVAVPTGSEPENDDETLAFDDRSGTAEPPDPDELREAGADAAVVERLAQRAFAADRSAVLRRFRRDVADTLPRRLSRRRTPSRHGAQPDMRRALREAARRDGEVMRLPMRARRTKTRRVLVLLDVSGSMKAQTEGALRAAHALVGTGARVEVFTLGTRLTRITRALRLRNPDQAFANAGALVADWDGGTRLGDALQAFLAVPRFAGHARGSLVLVISDGLERGTPGALVDAIARLSRLAWRLVWLTPLAEDRRFEPQTQALTMAAPHIDAFDSAADLDRLCTAIVRAGDTALRRRVA